MRIYFVRHGESRDGQANIFQSGTTPLSEKGSEQARIVAKRFLNIPIDAIIASDYERAHQTAKEIANILKKELTMTELARERNAPSEIYGKSVHDSEAKAIQNIANKNFSNPDFHYSDEENFLDLKTRAIKLVGYLKNRPEENLLVVLHGTILRCVIALMMFGEELTPDTFSHFSFFFLENTGVTVCDWKNGAWKLITWNDQSHL
ncbi:MAG: histidine phosphatase family protein [Patescibacteria group bacterium]